MPKKKHMKSTLAGLKDGILILSLGALVFFGALFLFASINEESDSGSISLQETEEILDKKINSRISAIEAKLKFKKRKPLVSRDSTSSIDSIEQSSIVSSDLDLYKTSESVQGESDSILSETMEMVNDEEESEAERRAYIQSYKSEYIRRAKQDGWEVKLNDDLEVVSAKKIKLKR